MISKSLEETAKFAAEVLEKVSVGKKEGATVLALRGDLGSGKTAFVKGLAKELGVEELVTSPTFVLEKIYKINHLVFTHLVHIDAYRLEDEHELLALGFRDLISDGGNLIAIEWPERVAKALPKDAFYINFKTIAEGEREISW
ncbi:MAG: tRNA (adenosine(37)-N6)-threonylcarbamoyltransferase complex ATPase subunit type 1 TsaE [Patescibacteria group bacterium]